MGKRKMNREERMNLWFFHSRSEPHRHKKDTSTSSLPIPLAWVCILRTLLFPPGSLRGTQCDLVSDTVTDSSLLRFVMLGEPASRGREEGFCQNSPKQSMQTVPEASLLRTMEVTVDICKLLGVLATVTSSSRNNPSQRALCLINNSFIQARLN